MFVTRFLGTAKKPKEVMNIKGDLMLKKQVVVGDVIAYQPGQNQGPYKARVVNKTNEYEGIELEVNYTETLYNPRPDPDRWRRVKTNGKYIIAFWDDYVQQVEIARDSNTTKKMEAKALHRRSQLVSQKLVKMGIAHTPMLSVFTLSLESMEKLLGVEEDS